MDTATLVGLLLGFVGVFGGNMMEGGSISALINIPGFMIVVLGSIGAGIANYPLETAKRLPKILGKVFKKQEVNTARVVPIFVRMADKARREGLLSLEEESQQIDDAYMRKGLQLMIDGTDATELRDIMEIETEAMEERHATNRGLLEAIGGYAPTLGVLGAIMGLIAVLSNLNDTESLGHGIAVAFVASIAYRLALRCYDLREADARRRAGILQRLGWIAREQADDESEQRYLALARDDYLQAFQRDDRVSEDAAVTLSYLVGDLSLRLGLIDEAMRWFDATLQMERAKGHPEIIRRTRDRWGEARDLARAKRAAP